jgi:hypothetical protein
MRFWNWELKRSWILLGLLVFVAAAGGVFSWMCGPEPVGLANAPPPPPPPPAPYPTSYPQNFFGLAQRNNAIAPASFGPIQYFHGVVRYQADGISLPGPVFGFSHRPSYNNNHQNGENAQHDDGNSDLPNGFNWHTGLLRLIDMGDDELRLVGEGNAASQYVLDGGAGFYKGKLGIDAKIDDNVTNRLALFTTAGAEVRFYDFSQGAKAGLFEKLITPKGQEITLSLNGDNLPDTLTDAGGRTWKYTYVTIDGKKRVSKLEVKVGTTLIGEVNYLYYGDTSETFASGSGTNGDLMRIVVKERDTGGSVGDVERTTLFRYYTSPAHRLRYIVEPESYAALQASLGTTDPLEASDATIADFANYYFAYQSQKPYRVTTARIRATGMGCGCGGTADEYTFSYDADRDPQRPTSTPGLSV